MKTGERSQTRATNTIYAIAVLLGTSLGLGSDDVSAQVLEEIIVTAQKREQNVQDVGIAINTFSSKQLSELGVEDSFDIAQITPGVHIAGAQAGNTSVFTVRGVTQNDFADVAEAPVAVYIDEGYAALGQAHTFAMFDLERVEVLKGPQGTLFGRNATGGLLHFITRKPTFDTQGYGKITYGSYDHIRFEGAAGSGFSESLAGRVAVLHNRHDGYLDNRYPGLTAPLAGPPPSPDSTGDDLGDDDTTGVRGSLLFKPTDRITALATATWARTETATGPYQNKPVLGQYESATSTQLFNVIDLPPGETRNLVNLDTNTARPLDLQTGLGPILNRPVPNGDSAGFVDPDGDGRITSCDLCFADASKVETWGVNGKLDWTLANDVSLVLVTDYKDYYKWLMIDVDAGPLNQVGAFQGVEGTSWTQEVRLSGESERWRWLVGFYYLNIDIDNSVNGLRVPFPVGIDLPAESALETDSYSVFGQAEFGITEELSLIAGVRAIQEEKDFDWTQSIYLNFDPRSHFFDGPRIATDVPAPDQNGDVAPRTLQDSSSDTLWAGKLQLDWRPRDGLLLYAGVNRGVKAGSFNAQSPGAGQVSLDFVPYDEEVLYSYEGGFKAELFQGNARLNGSAYYYDYNDYQAFLFTGVSGVVVNNDAENIGFELDLETSPLQGLDVRVGVSYFDAEVQDVEIGLGSGVFRDVKPVSAPETQISAMVRYEWPLFGGMMAVMGDMSYSDESFYNLRNFDADKFDSYVIGNIRLTWTDANDRWQGALFVNNVGDERAGVIGFSLADICGCNEVYYQKPRWVGASLQYGF